MSEAAMSPRADTTYRVIPLYDGAFGIEVTVAGSYPATVSAFDTIEEAEAWIARNRQVIGRAASSVAAQPAAPRLTVS